MEGIGNGDGGKKRGRYGKGEGVGVTVMKNSYSRPCHSNALTVLFITAVHYSVVSREFS